MESLLLNRSNSPNYDKASTSGQDRLTGDTDCFEDIGRGGASRSQISVSSEPVPRATVKSHLDSMYHGAWPNMERTGMWNSEPASLGTAAQQKQRDTDRQIPVPHDVGSVMSFASSSGGVPLDNVLCGSDRGKWSSQQLEAKMDVVHSLLSMLGSQEHVDMGETLLALSTCPESCLAMRQSGCIPLLVQLVQSDKDNETRRKASQALHNLVNSQPDEKVRKREARILKLLEHARNYVEYLKNGVEFELEVSGGSVGSSSENGDKHPVETVAHLMKLSFDEGHRQAICQLGGIHTIAAMVEIEHSTHGSGSAESHCVLMRRYACMALTNLTFGDGGNKALLCSLRDFMRSLVAQLQSPADELRQVTASVLRNLSWRADSTSKEVLKDAGSVTALMRAAMLQNKENTLKSILSALWNLSAHCTENKSEICSVEGALGFLVNMLTYKTPTKSLSIVENAGGILRNISSQIAVRDDYREILRQHGCLQILLDQLKSPSLTIVSNACGTLWNLSAKNAQDQEALWQLGAPAMLRSLNHSKHKMIAMGSSAALKNLLSCRPQQALTSRMDSTALSLNLPELPTLGARKQKALLQDLDQSLSETFENIDKDSPVKNKVEKSVDIDSFMRNKSRSRSPEDLNAAFSSLNLNEPSTSYTVDLRQKTRIPQSYGSSSLPYVPQPTRRSNPATFIPVRNKFPDQNYEDDVCEQPIDYSRKYTVSDVPVGPQSSPKDGGQQEGDSFSMGYTETDLDQPTDYSLRYAENDSDSDICVEITKQEYIQDTVKTYCTEGTPYETPYIFSNATSISDLRNVGSTEQKPELIDNDIQKNKESKAKEVKNVDEKDHCSTEDISEIENADLKPRKSEFSSGLMSPEKPVNYCEEGTPGYFSRGSSFGSGLDSIPVNETVIKKEEPEEVETSSTQKTAKAVQMDKQAKAGTEAKEVKFEQVVNYAEETPLMYSRSSSLASLDSIEQHSIHDDRSSVVSDFSRLTSGIVSPSELPDSPTQTVPPSPRPTKSKLEFPSTSKLPRNSNENKPRPLQKPSVFEDNITKFKEESTPVQFSTATSLSSLTIDDHEENTQNNTQEKEVEVKATVKEETIKQEQQEKTDREKDTDKELSGSDDLNDDDEEILAACINDGMQSNISAPTASSTPTKLQMSSFSYQHSKASSGIPMMRRTPPRNVAVGSSHLMEDAPKTYCTEDTPAHLSRTGSNSNLSVLSIPNDNKSKQHGDFSDDSSNLSGDNENLLAECIQSAMPKPKKEIKVTALPHPIRSSPYKQQAQRKPGGEFVQVPPLKPQPQQQGANRRETSLPPYLGVRDEVENYAVEGSPCHFSLRSSLSDLTVEGGSVVGLKTSHNKPSAAGSNEAKALPPENVDVSKEARLSNVARKESLSSLSLDSSGSNDAADRALLEECIYSSMPIDKHEEALLKECIKAGMPKSTGSTGGADRSMGGVMSPRRHSTAQPTSRRPSSDRHEPPRLLRSQHDQSKNSSAASVAGSASPGDRSGSPQGDARRPDTSNIAAADVGSDKSRAAAGSAVGTTTAQPAAQVLRVVEGGNSSSNRCSRSGENFLTDHTKSGSNKSIGQFLDSSYETDFSFSNSDNCANLDNVFAKSCEESGHLVDNRMLDPDAMIESLDRFTAELVSQASHLTKDKDRDVPSDKSKTTDPTNDDTWNDDTSPNEVTFPSISGSAPNVITFGSDRDENQLENDVLDGTDQPEEQSNDFSSINTSTMTESTLIAIEATKMATVFKMEAEMSQSLTSAASLDLDSIRPPSQMNSITNSTVIVEKIVPKSPQLVSRKNLLVKRALSNSLNQASSLESLESHSLSILDTQKPPAEMNQLIDVDFDLNDQEHHPIFNVKRDFALSGPLSFNGDLDFTNPPSIFNEITDMCNSLADVPTEAIGTETSIFEDCFTHMEATLVDQTLQDDDTAEFSDANSVTPIQTDQSSAENTPKKSCKPVNKSMMTKQRRNLARERYKTYTVAAEMVMQESIEMETKVRDEETSENTYVSPTYTVEASKEKQEESKSNNVSPSPTRSKLSIRRNFMQKRLENKERFRTQTLSESSFGSPELASASPPCDTNDIHFLVQKEADLVLRTLRDSKFQQDEMLDCETLSLVSNDEDSEHNSGSSMNYRTYHKSWGGKKHNLPTIPSQLTNGEVCESTEQQSTTVPVVSPPRIPDPPALDSSGSEELNSDEENRDSIPVKPKIVKPTSNEIEETPQNESVPKGIRGRRKPLYSKSNVNNKVSPKTIKPAKTMTSNLVTNVTSSLKSGASLKPTVTRQIKPPSTVKSSGYGVRSNGATPVRSAVNSRANSQNGSPKSSPKHSAKGTPPLERQGTFTKEDKCEQSSPKPPSRLPAPPSKIPSFASKIARAVTNRIPTSSNNPSSRLNARNGGVVKSASTDRANRNPKIYNRSTSADSREPQKKLQPSSSTQSLKNEAKVGLRRTGIPAPAQRSTSNASITSNGSAKKQVTSKIASLWKRVEESKSKQQSGPDKRVWIEQEQKQPDPPRLIRSGTFENKDGVVLRHKGGSDETPPPTSDEKRVSRLGSFIVMDENGDNAGHTPTVVPAVNT
ncbi:adenomatous polyposis coli protein-like isoform X2 [Sitophilus oryzae]|nr:adenomatous polyposis coli protein-like isoform X2 [Sitophilus oryzae]XP_030746143.1 adenomatous polyposis coli protein-like isoform X2 [Sitophilus oryzae]XP_030746159.1 adenomatous polyposis coli protein-like isoform X2 [Sitophilus oryzae]